MKASTRFLPTSHPQRVRVSAWVFFLSGACAGPLSSAQAHDASKMNIAELEKAFWACDFAASTGRIVGASAAACSSFTETLKVRKFNGEFSAMLNWWQERKPAEHAALYAAGDDRTAPIAAQSK